MKRITTFLAILSIVMLSTPVYAQNTLRNTVKDSVDEETQAEVQEAVDSVQEDTFDVRKEATLTVLNEAEEKLLDVEKQLQASVYASADTKEDGQVLIDSAQKELANIQATVQDAEDTSDLTAARADAVTWLQENKELAKELSVDIYIDSLEAAVLANQETIKGAKALVVYYTQYDLDTTTLEALIDTAETGIEEADGDVDAAASERTRESMDTATRSTADATEDVADVLEEANNLYTELESAE